MRSAAPRPRENETAHAIRRECFARLARGSREIARLEGHKTQHKPRGGRVLLDGQAITSLSTREVARQLALLPQGPSLVNDMSVEELVWMGRSPHQGILGLPTTADRDSVEWAMAETGVSDMRRRAVGSGDRVALFSGGGHGRRNALHVEGV